MRCYNTPIHDELTLLNFGFRVLARRILGDKLVQVERRTLALDAMCQEWRREVYHSWYRNLRSRSIGYGV